MNEFKNEVIRKAYKKWEDFSQLNVLMKMYDIATGSTDYTDDIRILMHQRELLENKSRTYITVDHCSLPIVDEETQKLIDKIDLDLYYKEIMLSIKVRQLYNIVE